MSENTLASVAERKKFVITEKEVVYKVRKRHKVDLPVTTISSPEVAKRLLQPLFEASPTEKLFVIAMNSRGEFLGFLKIADGTVGRASVYPRNLVSFILHETNACQIILAHNHPGGCTKPSKEDRKVTAEIKELLSKLEVTLLEHLIYAPASCGGEGTWVSFSANGIIP